MVRYLSTPHWAAEDGDFIVGLDTLACLSHGDNRRLRPALELSKKERRPEGTWALDKVHPDLRAGAGYRFCKKPERFALETGGRPTKWISLTALRVLKRIEELGRA